MTDSGEYSISDDEPTAQQPTSVSVPYKVKGELTNADTGIGVIGINTTASGTTKGVEGRVSSASGYGLFTPDNARVHGWLETGRVVFDDRGTDGLRFYLEEGSDDNLTLSHGNSATHKFAPNGDTKINGELTENASL